MKNGFVWGIVAGVASTVAVYSGISALRPGGNGGEPAQKQAAVPPASPVKPSREPSALSIELEQLRESEGNLREELAQSRKKAELAEELIRKLGKEHEEMSRAAQGAEQERKDQEAQKKAVMEKIQMRRHLKVGQAMDEEIAAYLGLDEWQKKQLEAEFQKEEAALKAHLKELYPQMLDGKTPSDDNLASLTMEVGGALMKGEEYQKLIGALTSDKEVMSGKKTLYLDELLGPDSLYLKRLETLFGIREMTMRNASGFLRKEQQEKLVDLGRNWYQITDGAAMAIGGNTQFRRPK